MDSTFKKNKELQLINNLLFSNSAFSNSLFDEIDYKKFIVISSSNLLIPILYKKLKHRKSLSKIPKDLEIYFSKIYEINKQRNKNLLKEIKSISDVLNRSKIRYCFFKGSSLLLNKVYGEDERMIGDIDIYVDKKDLYSSVEYLKEMGYKEKNSKYYINKLYRHYPKLTDENKLFSVEIHDKLFRYGYNGKLSSELFSKLIFNKKYKAYHSNIKDELDFTILNNQINDWGFLTKNLNLRNVYDFYSLYHKISEVEFKKNKYTKSYLNILSDFKITFLDSKNRKETLRYKLRKFIFFRFLEKIICKMIIYIVNTTLKIIFVVKSQF